jgi:Kef-type K+ transport system membrane component KefB
MSTRLAPRWVAITNAALVGWNTGLFCALLSVITIMLGLARLGVAVHSGVGTLLVSAAAVALGVWVGSTTARRLVGWFKRRAPQHGYIWLVLLLIFTALFLPTPFGFSAG